MKKGKKLMSDIAANGKLRAMIVAVLVIAAAAAGADAARTVFAAGAAAGASAGAAAGGQSVEASATERKLPIYSVETPEKKVAISFDAAWGADDTGTLLDILQQHDVRATFFLCGYWVDDYPEEVKRIAEAGHDIGNHGNTHAHGAQLDLAKNKAEIEGVHEKIKELIGVKMNLFRPPFGEYNNTVITAAEELDYYTIQWDVDSLYAEVKKAGEMREVRAYRRAVLIANSGAIRHSDFRQFSDSNPGFTI